MIFDKNFRDILVSQWISVLGGFIVGTLVAIYVDKVILIPGMLILLPGFLEMRGNISGSFASRISSGLFLKVIKPRRFNGRIIRGNLMASFLLVILVFFFLGIVVFLFNLVLLKVYMPRMIFIPLIAGILANFIETPLTIFATFYLFKKGHDPNNIMGPFITSTGDITSIIALIITIIITFKNDDSSSGSINFSAVGVMD